MVGKNPWPLRVLSMKHDGIKWRMIIAVILHSAVHIYDFWYNHNFIIILSRVYNEPIQRLAPSWLVSLTGRALHGYRRGQGFESRTSLNFFSCFLFATAKVAYMTAMIILHLILHSAVHIYDSHIFITSATVISLWFCILNFSVIGNYTINIPEIFQVFTVFGVWQ